ncbi:hypothetical protein HZA96_06935 [Candidatus Woesearchaeota archaeon]|nr:hypothetical protein [Candidatus Woesearchaeota archaeon]
MYLYDNSEMTVKETSHQFGSVPQDIAEKISVLFEANLKERGFPVTSRKVQSESDFSNDKNKERWKEFGYMVDDS